MYRSPYVISDSFTTIKISYAIRVSALAVARNDTPNTKWKWGPTQQKTFDESKAGHRSNLASLGFRVNAATERR